MAGDDVDERASAERDELAVAGRGHRGGAGNVTQERDPVADLAFADDDPPGREGDRLDGACQAFQHRFQQGREDRTAAESPASRLSGAS